MENIEEKVASLVREQSGEDVAVTRETLLMEGAGLDSLDVLELTMAIEETFDVEIDDRNMKSAKTVGDIAAIAKKAVEAKNA